MSRFRVQGSGLGFSVLGLGAQVQARVQGVGSLGNPYGKDRALGGLYVSAPPNSLKRPHLFATLTTHHLTLKGNP